METELRNLLTSMGAEVADPVAPPPGFRRRTRRRRARNAIAAGLASVVAVSGVTGLVRMVADRGGVASSACSGAWTSDVIPLNRTPLYAVEVLAGDDVWIAGSGPSDDFPGKLNTVIKHWDGRRWTDTPVNIQDEWGFSIDSFSAAGPDDVWAAGKVFVRPADRAMFGEGLLLHWDGAAWRRVPGPPVAGNHSFRTVNARPGSVLLFGSGDSGIDPFLFEWNGAEWREAGLPGVPQERLLLTDLVRTTGDDVMALGWNFDLKEFGVSEFGVFHRRGGVWRRTLTTKDVLNAMSVMQDGRVVVGGHTKTDLVADRAPVVKEWDGTQWRDLPAPAEPITGIEGVVASASDDVWAIGTSDPLEATKGGVANPNQKSVREPAVEVFVSHWDGRAWTTPASVHDASYSQIGRVDALPDGTTVAVGWTSGVAGKAPAESSGGLILRRC